MYLSVIYLSSSYWNKRQVFKKQRTVTCRPHLLSFFFLFRAVHHPNSHPLPWLASFKKRFLPWFPERALEEKLHMCDVWLLRMDVKDKQEISSV